MRRAKPFLRGLPAACVIVAAVLVIEAALYFGRIPNYIIPRPSQVALELMRNFSFYAFHGAITLLEAISGAVIAIITGIFIGSMIALRIYIRQAVLPVMIAAQAVPIIALAPIFVLWFGAGIASKVAMATVLCWFPVIINSAIGLQSYRREHDALFFVLGTSLSQRYRHLMFPSSVPFLMSGIKICAGSGMIGAIVAEYAGADRGLGYIVMQSTYRLDTTKLFAAVFVAGLCGIGLYALVEIFQRLVLRRFFYDLAMRGVEP